MMNRQSVLSFALVGLLMSSVPVKAVDPMEALPYLGAFLFGAPACVVSYKKMNNIWSDYRQQSQDNRTMADLWRLHNEERNENAKVVTKDAIIAEYGRQDSKKTNIYQDLGNVFSSTAVVTAAIAAGTLAVNPKKTMELVVPAVGTGLAMGGLWLALKHGCGNDQLRLREVVVGTTAFGFTMHELAQRRAAFRFGTH